MGAGSERVSSGQLTVKRIINHAQLSGDAQCGGLIVRKFELCKSGQPFAPVDPDNGRLVPCRFTDFIKKFQGLPDALFQTDKSINLSYTTVKIQPVRTRNLFR